MIAETLFNVLCIWLLLSLAAFIVVCLVFVVCALCKAAKAADKHAEKLHMDAADRELMERFAHEEQPVDDD